jgi:hypothetical protein
MEVIISKSNNKMKKYMARFDDKKTIHFGQAGASDYTLNKDDTRKSNYIARHSNENNNNINNVKSAGFLARNILWNRLTITDSIKDLNKKYKNVKFIYN